MRKWRLVPMSGILFFLVLVQRDLKSFLISFVVIAGQLFLVLSYCLIISMIDCCSSQFIISFCLSNCVILLIQWRPNYYFHRDKGKCFSACWLAAWCTGFTWGHTAVSTWGKLFSRILLFLTCYDESKGSISFWAYIPSLLWQHIFSAHSKKTMLDEPSNAQSFKILQ